MNEWLNGLVARSVCGVNSGVGWLVRWLVGWLVDRTDGRGYTPSLMYDIHDACMCGADRTYRQTFVRTPYVLCYPNESLFAPSVAHTPFTHSLGLGLCTDKERLIQKRTHARTHAHAIHPAIQPAVQRSYD